MLIAEYNGHRVTERDLKGNVLWQRQVQTPVACQRLPNGNTFIACPSQLLIVDAANKQVFHHARPGNDIMTARRLRDGQIVFVANGGQAIRLDANGKHVRTFPVNYQHQFGGIDVLRNGHLLVPQIHLGKVVEFDLEGKVVWSATCSIPRRRNGCPTATRWLPASTIRGCSRWTGPARKSGTFNPVPAPGRQPAVEITPQAHGLQTVGGRTLSWPGARFRCLPLF